MEFQRVAFVFVYRGEFFERGVVDFDSGDFGGEPERLRGEHHAGN